MANMSMGGLSRHPLYKTWHCMISRCNKPHDERFSSYGGRGIRVCERWMGGRAGFSNFCLDMGSKPSPQHTLDRIDVNGNYEPANCRWATQYEQNRNRRDNVVDAVLAMQIRWLVRDGGYMQVTVAKALGITAHTVRGICRNRSWVPQEDPK